MKFVIAKSDQLEVLGQIRLEETGEGYVEILCIVNGATWHIGHLDSDGLHLDACLPDCFPTEGEGYIKVTYD